MSYKLVDAVNQQMPKTVNATEMLLLTKFAELVVDPMNPSYRIGRDHFIAMTHAKDRRVRNNLNSLHKKGFLVCLEKRENKRPGDHPTLYKLRLPEGYDEATVNERRGRFYAGKPFKSKYSEDNAEFGSPPKSLSPVMRNDGLDEKAETLDKKAETLDKKAPSKISRSKDIIINDDDDVVKAAKEEAAKATGSKPSAFNKCGITAGNAEIVREVIKGFCALRKARPDYVIKSPVGFLIDRIRKGIENGTAEGLFGELPKANDATDEANARFEAAWKKVVGDLDLAKADKDLLRSVHDELKAKFGKKAGGKTLDEAALNDICKKVTAATPDECARELSGEINNFFSS